MVFHFRRQLGTRLHPVESARLRAHARRAAHRQLFGDPFLRGLDASHLAGARASDVLLADTDLVQGS